ncbi:hypothetical protein FIV34_00800 [Luteibacter pinisoli]|uniref:Uncharacterized protein n=1 Tax=Luteibacter pinisoli TaxID=2589080 RepID=A0A4Y5YY37_9GAMM|nr:hypothetical protein [Luteibacter pinisoli]QDE37841.1 hypothetical protein FIV34_00800 [Luteibacter pinisoli]
MTDTTPPVRATLDQDVIDAWQVALAEYKRKGGWVYAIATACALASVAWWIATRQRLAMTGLVAGLGIGAIYDARARQHLRCPHCGQPPIYGGRRQDVLTMQWCPHCYYWLRKPW